MKLFTTILFLPFLVVLISADSVLDILKKFHQSDYKLKYERGEIVSCNYSIMKICKLATFKYNRTQAVTNITLGFKIDIPRPDMDVVLKLYKFLSNEYRDSSMRLRANFCDGLKYNVFGIQRTMSCGNFSGCPFSKDKVYHVCNYHPDESMFPPLIPSGSYMLRAEFTSERLSKNPYLIWRYYGTIYRPLKY